MRGRVGRHHRKHELQDDEREADDEPEHVGVVGCFCHDVWLLDAQDYVTAGFERQGEGDEAQEPGDGESDCDEG